MIGQRVFTLTAAQIGGPPGDGKVVFHRQPYNHTTTLSCGTAKVGHVVAEIASPIIHYRPIYLSLFVYHSPITPLSSNIDVEQGVAISTIRRLDFRRFVIKSPSASCLNRLPMSKQFHLSNLFPTDSLWSVEGIQCRLDSCEPKSSECLAWVCTGFSAHGLSRRRTSSRSIRVPQKERLSGWGLRPPPHHDCHPRGLCWKRKNRPDRGSTPSRAGRSATELLSRLLEESSTPTDSDSDIVRL